MTCNIVKISDVLKKSENKNELEQENNEEKCINNKVISICRLLEENMFNYLCHFTNVISGKYYAYIPWFDNDVYIKHEDYEFHANFKGLSSENNYADLGFVNDVGEYKFFKAHRVKTIEAIPIDGSISTYDEQSINNYTYFVFYSNDSKESQKTVIMTTDAYIKLVDLSTKSPLKYFNIHNIELYRKLGFSETELMYVDNLNTYSYDNYDSEDKELIKRIIENRKRRCIITLKLKGFKENIKFKRTHFGNQYSAINYIDGRVIHFRDCKSRDNFFKREGLDFNSQLVTSNCNNQDKIIDDLEYENLKSNIFEKKGWIIMHYTPNVSILLERTKILLEKLSEKSVRWYNRLKQLISNIGGMILSSVKDIYCKINKKFEFQLKAILNLTYINSFIYEVNNYNCWKYYTT